MSSKALFAAFFLIVGVHSVALSQSAPSWRSAAERPERVDAPPEVGAPEISFEIDRDSLFGKPMGFAPADDPVEATPDILAVQPELGTTQADSELSSLPNNDEPVEEVAQDLDSMDARAAEALNQPATSQDSSLTASLTEAHSGDQNADQILDQNFNPSDDQAVPLEDALADNPGTDREVEAAREERDAVQEAARVVPEQSVASIDSPAPVSSMAKPQTPAESILKLVRTQTVSPEYPKKAARLGEEGWVDLQLTIEPSGKVSHVSVVESQPRNLFDSAARRAARQWRYQAPSLAGVSEPVTTQIRLNFVLD